MADGITLPVRWLPALQALKRPRPLWFRITSARMLRAELPAQRKRTLTRRAFITIASDFDPDSHAQQLLASPDFVPCTQHASFAGTTGSQQDVSFAMSVSSP